MLNLLQRFSVREWHVTACHSYYTTGVKDMTTIEIACWAIAATVAGLVVLWFIVAVWSESESDKDYF